MSTVPSYLRRFGHALPLSATSVPFFVLPMGVGAYLGARLDRQRLENAGLSSHAGMTCGLLAGALLGTVALAAYAALDRSL